MGNKIDDPDIYLQENLELAALAKELLLKVAPDILDHVPSYLSKWGNNNVSKNIRSIPQGGHYTNAFTTELLNIFKSNSVWLSPLMDYCNKSKSIDIDEDIDKWEDIMFTALVSSHIAQGLSAQDIAETLNVFGPHRFLSDVARCELVPKLNLMGIGLHQNLDMSERKMYRQFYVVNKS